MESPRSETSSVDFKKWFAGSKVTDKDGRPLVLYHGTASLFTKFDPYFLGSVSESSDSKAGFWFTTSEQRAHEAARDAMQMSGTNTAYVMRVYLQMKNPKKIALIRDMDPDTLFKVAQRAKKSGHDGIIFGEGEHGGTDYLVFSPDQIRLSKQQNSDAYDPNEERNARGEWSAGGGRVETEGGGFINGRSFGVRDHTVWISPDKKVFSMGSVEGLTHFQWVHDNWSILRRR